MLRHQANAPHPAAVPPTRSAVTFSVYPEAVMIRH